MTLKSYERVELAVDVLDELDSEFLSVPQRIEWVKAQALIAIAEMIWSAPPLWQRA